MSTLLSALGKNNKEKFTALPQDFLGGSNFTYHRMTLSNGVVDAFAPGLQSGARMYHVFTFGIPNRCVQIAVFGFMSMQNTNKIWMRTQHDSTASDWVEK